MNSQDKNSSQCWRVISCSLLLLSFLSCSNPSESEAPSWKAQVSGTTEDLHAVWGSSGRDVFAVGDYGVILHYNGTSWGSMSSGTNTTLYSVWGTSGNNVYAVGDSGTVVHYNGRSWSAVQGAYNLNYRGSWCAPDGRVFIAAANGSMAVLSGANWTQISSPGFDSIKSVSGYSGLFHPSVRKVMTDIYACGLKGVVHVNEQGNERISSGRPVDLWVASWSDYFLLYGSIFVVRTTDEKDKVMRLTVTTQLNAITATSPSNVFVVGEDISHYDGNAWSIMQKPVSGHLYDVWAASSQNAFAVGTGGTILHYAR